MKIFESVKPSNHKASKITKMISAKASKVARSNSKNLKDSAQDTLASAKDTVQLAYAEVEKSMRQGWNKTLTWLTLAASIVVPILQRNMQKAQDNLNIAQRTLEKVQGPLQSTVISRLIKASQALGKSTDTARDSLKQATTRAKEMQLSWQERSIQRQLRRKRARRAFRWGILLGVVVALLYSPIRGSEARQRISQGWQQSLAYFKNRNRRLGIPA
jgi:putative cell wall-binding protein